MWRPWSVASVQFSCSVVSDSLRPHGLQHARLPCPSQTPRKSESEVSQSCPTLCNSMDYSTPGFPVRNQLLELTSIELVMPSNHLIFCCPLLLPPSILTSIRVFSNESALRIRWPKYWSFSFSISPSNQYSGLISSRMDWLDLLAVQGTLKSLFQNHSSKASVLQCSAFFIVHLSYPHWRRKWQPTPVFLPGESHGQRSLVGCHLWGCTESNTTEAT